jgi:hypothetical protein
MSKLNVQSNSCCHSTPQGGCERAPGQGRSVKNGVGKSNSVMSSTLASRLWPHFGGLTTTCCSACSSPLICTDRYPTIHSASCTPTTQVLAIVNNTVNTPQPQSCGLCGGESQESTDEWKTKTGHCIRCGQLALPNAGPTGSPTCNAPVAPGLQTGRKRLLQFAFF